MLVLNIAQIAGFVKVVTSISLLVVTGICQNLCMDFSEFLHGFVNMDTWLSLSCYTEVSKLIYGFL